MRPDKSAVEGGVRTSLIRLVRLTVGGEPIALGNRPSTVTISGVAVDMPPGLFLQAVPEAETMLADLRLSRGNAGGVSPGSLALRITDPHGADQHVGQLPARVMSLDENFIVVRRDARVGFSVDLSGFHFYGADICLNADVMGHSAYVVDFHLLHLSAGTKNLAFDDMEARFRAKWSRALAPRWMQTTCSLLRLSGDTLGRITGRVDVEDLLDVIFREFCIGK